MAVDLKKLAELLDSALAKEDKESLINFLNAQDESRNVSQNEDKEKKCDHPIDRRYWGSDGYSKCMQCLKIL